MPPLFRGGRLVGAQRVETGLDGFSYVAGYVRGAPGALAERAAAWRVLEPGGTLPVPERTITPVNEVAAAVTPVLGFSTGDDDGLRKAVECAEQARSR